MMSKSRDYIAQILNEAGGQIVGRTKLQKLVYLLELTGLGMGFDFEYRHYGPYSESLSEAVRSVKILGIITEEEKIAGWGGSYSIYKINKNSNCYKCFNEVEKTSRSAFLKKAVHMDSIELELAATAAYLAVTENIKDPWFETQKRKPEKATADRINSAKTNYIELTKIKTPKPLPELAR